MPPDQPLPPSPVPNPRPAGKGAGRARKALRTLARHTFEQYLPETVSTAAPPSNTRPSALLGAWFTLMFHEHHDLADHLFAKVRAGEHRGAGSWEQMKEENFHQEMTTYIHLLMRPLVVKSHAVTSMHRLLAMLVPHCAANKTEQNLWAGLTVCRIPGGSNKGTAGLMGQTLEGRLRILCAREQRRQAKALADGNRHGYAPGSASPTAIAEAGPVFLCLPNGWCARVPEELGLGDVLNLLPAPLNMDLFRAYHLDRALIAQTRDDREDAGERLSDDETIKELHSKGLLSPAFVAFEALEDIFTTLNDPYANKVILTGLPSAIGLELGRTVAEGLTALRIKAAETAAANRRPVTPADWEEAWRALGGVPGYDRFADFSHSEAGQFLLYGRTVVPMPEPDGPEPAVPPADVGLTVQIGLWEKRGNLTAAEAFALRWSLDWDHQGAHHLQTAVNSPALPGAIAPRLAAEYPYHLIPDPDQRFKLFLFFFARRAARLVDRDMPGGRSTAAENIVLSLWDGRLISPAAWPQFAARLRNSADLSKALKTKPYCWVPAESRLDVLIFFFNRDMTALVKRPA